ncbi:hypothetical protein Ancab_036031 [Ancistrocladus abbreviatus]
MRPNPPRPIRASDQCHHSSPTLGSHKPSSGNSNTSCGEGCRPTKVPKANKISKRPRGIKFSHKRMGSRIKQNDKPSAAAAKIDSQLAAAELVPTVESLHDSDITNMNRLFLNKFNAMTAAEIWEVGQQLGIQSKDTGLFPILVAFPFLLGRHSSSSVQTNRCAEVTTFLLSIGKYAAGLVLGQCCFGLPCQGCGVWTVVL